MIIHTHTLTRIDFIDAMFQPQGLCQENMLDRKINTLRSLQSSVCGQPVFLLCLLYFALHNTHLLVCVCVCVCLCVCVHRHSETTVAGAQQDWSLHELRGSPHPLPPGEMRHSETEGVHVGT